VGKLLTLVAFSTAVLGPAATASGGRSASTPCTGATLSGTFKAIPNSAGAGNIVYRLRVEDTGPAACFVTGLPGVGLLDRSGHKLPTAASFAGRPGVLTAVMVTLRPGSGTATLTARFSPDVPGPGEPVTGRQCERTAYKLRVTPSGGGSVVVPISPPTPVCEHGGLQLTSFTRG